MVVFSARHRSVFMVLAAACMLLVSMSASAAFTDPQLQITVTSGGSPIFSSGPTALTPAGGVGSVTFYAPSFNEASFNMSGNVTTDSSLASVNGIKLGSVLSFQNKHNAVLEFVVTLTWDPLTTVGVDWSTEAAINALGPAGFAMSSLPGTPIWTSGLNGGPITSFFPDPTTLTTPAPLTAGPALGSIGPVSSMSIDMAFSLTPGTTGGLNGDIRLIPAPGALALLAVGGLTSRRRRRR